MLIFIIGYMASGKTTIGRMLAEKLQFRFVDLDEEMESLTGKTITEIFNENGEEAFREKESELVRLHLADVNTVIATGGGTPCYRDNMELMNANGTTVFLDAPVEIILQRLSLETERRPLLKGIPVGALPGFISFHYEIRRKYYEKAAMTVCVINNDAAEIILSISI